MQVTTHTQRCYVELSEVLLRFKAGQLDKHDLAKAVVLALVETGIERHHIHDAYEELGI